MRTGSTLAARRPARVPPACAAHACRVLTAARNTSSAGASPRDRFDDARRGGRERVGTRAARARRILRVQTRRSRGRGSRAVSGCPRRSPPPRRRPHLRRHADDVQRDWHAGASSDKRRQRAQRRTRARPAPIRSAAFRECEARDTPRSISSRCDAPAHTIGAADSTPRQPTQQRQPASPAYSPPPDAASARSRWRPRRPRPQSILPRPTSVANPSIGEDCADVERLALSDPLVGVDQPDLANAIAQRQRVRERAAESCRRR